MYPIVFTIPWIDLPISSFGLLMAGGFLVGTWLTARRMAEEDLDPELATTLLLYVMAGGVLGSKLYYAVDVSIREGIPFASLLFARDGITWFGGLLGGITLGAIGCRLHGIPVRVFMNCVAAPLAVGQAIGRLGCFMVGDDYGRVSDVPWALAFPEGAPPTLDRVHPTQLYEMGWLLAVASFLYLRRRRSPFLFGEYLALAGLGRLVVEHWRVNPRVALGLTEPQWIGIGLALLGAGSWYAFRRPREPAAS